MANLPIVYFPGHIHLINNDVVWCDGTTSETVEFIAPSMQLYVKDFFSRPAVKKIDV